MDVSTSHGRLSAAAKAFIARRHKLLIDGQWVAARSGKSFAVFDPSNGQQIAQVAEGGAADVDAPWPPRGGPSRRARGRG
jgi:phenylacetaldehyde dehydrogenase